MAKYEALLLGLKAKRNLKIECLIAFGDLEVVVKKIQHQCPTKHPWLRDYGNEVWNLVENLFLAFNVQLLPREGN